MSKNSKYVAGFFILIGAVDVIGSSTAFARGGGSNFMNSPGYQRRLQESRGQVTNQSGSVFPASPPNGYRGRSLKMHRAGRGDAESTMLANKDDPHSIKVFDARSRARPIASSIRS
jgi:hypothetical protein